MAQQIIKVEIDSLSSPLIFFVALICFLSAFQSIGAVKLSWRVLLPVVLSAASRLSEGVPGHPHTAGNAGVPAPLSSATRGLVCNTAEAQTRATYYNNLCTASACYSLCRTDSQPGHRHPRTPRCAAVAVTAAN